MTKPAHTRAGTTTTINCGYATLDVTINEWDGGAEIFCKYRFSPPGAKDLLERAQKGDQSAAQTIMEALSAPQGYLDRICTLASIAMQGRGDRETVVRHLIGDKTWPRGIAGQPLSPIDAIGRTLKEEKEQHDTV